MPAAIRGDTIWCIGMSEPNAGSDLAGLQTRAVLDGDHFVVNGQKVWTSYAMVAAEVLLLRAHRPRRAEAQGHQPAHRRHGHARASTCARCATSAAPRDFAEVFFTDVEVPAREPRRRAQRRLAHHAGIARARARRALGRGRVRGSSRRINGLDRRSPRRRGLADDAGVRRQIATIYEQAASLRALGYKGFA